MTDSWYRGTLYASHAAYLLVTCSTFDEVYGCYDSNWYISVETAYFNCYSLACSRIGNIYIDNNNISSLKININGCTECKVVSVCISKWNIYCKSSDSYIYYNNSNIWYGDYCSNDYDCGCNLISPYLYFDLNDTHCVLSDDQDSSDMDNSYKYSPKGHYIGILFCFVSLLL